MKLLNAKGDDLSNEMIILMALVMEMAWAMQIISSKAMKALDRVGVNKSFFHDKRQKFTQGADYMDKAFKALNYALDGEFNFILERVPEHAKERLNAIQWQANEVIQILLIMYSRADGNFEKRERMKKALLNFKPDTDVEVDFDAMMKFFDYKKFEINGTV